jgi:type III secretory pathway component EscS
VQAIITEAIYIALVISLVPMLAISFGAGTVALIQAVTQVQEQSLVHFARLVVMALVLVWGGSHAFSELEVLFVKVVGFAALKSGG